MIYVNYCGDVQFDRDTEKRFQKNMHAYILASTHRFN